MLIEMDAKAAALWALLDDIDTLDDMAKENDAGYREHARRIQQKRFTIMSGDEWDAIREKYGKASSRNHDCHTPPPPTNAEPNDGPDRSEPWTAITPAALVDRIAMNLYSCDGASGNLNTVTLQWPARIPALPDIEHDKKHYRQLARAALLSLNVASQGESQS